MNLNLTLFMQALVFFVFIWLCAKFLWPPLARAIETRQKQIAEGLAAAEAGKQSFANTEKRVAEMLNEAKGRASEIIAQGEKLKAQTVEDARAEAKTEADRIIAGAKAEIEQEIARAKEALRNQVADLAVAGARRILEREIDPKAHADLLAEIQREL